MTAGRIRGDRVLLAIVLVAVALRIPGLFDDFWLDEIWSYRIARELHRPLDVLVSAVARTDNNDPLNTFLLWWLGEQPRWWVYRLPALLAGIGSVLVVASIASRRGRAEARVATVLVGLSYPLVVYSSEARGYAMVVLFALLAFDAVERYLRRPTTLRAAAYACACVGGFLSHLTFVHVFVGLVAWSVWRLVRRENLAHAVRALLILHGGPALFALVLYLVFVRHLTIGGAPERAFWPALAGSIASLVAAASSFSVDLLVTAVVIGTLAAVVDWLRRREADEWVFLLVAVVVSPALVLAWRILVRGESQAVYPRHFVVLLPFFLMALATMGVDLHRRGRARRGLEALLVAFAVANLWQTVRFLRGTRGHYAEAVAYMAANTPGATVAVRSDHPARTSVVLDFYARVLPPGKRLVVLDDAQDPRVQQSVTPMWVVAHGFDAGAPPGNMVTDATGARFRLAREFGYHGLSGYSWYVYRRSDD